MAVKYKKNGTWYDISSSSNNAVDAVENGNLNPVTSNAVYDALKASTIQKLSNLGSDYSLNPTDFNGKVTRHIVSFTNATSPNVQAEGDPSDSGDWDVYNLYNGGSDFDILIAVTPRKNYKIYFNFFWNGRPSGWKVLAIS